MPEWEWTSNSLHVHSLYIWWVTVLLTIWFMHDWSNFYKMMDSRSSISNLPSANFTWQKMKYTINCSFFQLKRLGREIKPMVQPIMRIVQAKTTVFSITIHWKQSQQCIIKTVIFENYIIGNEIPCFNPSTYVFKILCTVDSQNTTLHYNERLFPIYLIQSIM